MKINIKTALTKKEIEILKFLVRDESVLEIGSLLGYSTINMAQVAAHVTSIDPHCGYPFYNPSPTLQIFLNNLQMYNIYNVSPIINYAQNVLQSLKNKFQLAFIDCTGFYEDTLFCLEHCAAEIICCHDYGRRNCEGVNRSVNEFVKKYNKKIDIVDSLAIIT